MSEQPETSALAELLGAISDRRIRRKVQKLLGFGEEAVRSLGELDSALYLRENGEEQLQIVSDAVLSHVRRLLEYLGMVASSAEASEESSPDIELEFSVGNSPGAPATRSASRASTPGMKAAAGIASVQGKTDDEKWGALAAEMDSLQYGLGSELKEYDRRFMEALQHDRKEQAVRDLNDATTSLMDGVFAVMTTVYECFLGYAEPDRMIPGHRDTLGKALAVRRAIATLRREVQALNKPVQSRESSKDLVQTNHARIVESLVSFMDEDVFFYLRSDDRKEFVHFRELLSEAKGIGARHACEGFDKYLDSLSFVSQRGVLIKHDTDLRAKIADELKRALAYARLLPEIVCEAIEQAFIKSERLFGLNDQIDAVVGRWSSMTEAERNNVDAVIEVARQLNELVQPTVVAAPPDDTDFF